MASLAVRRSCKIHVSMCISLQDRRRVLYLMIVT